MGNFNAVIDLIADRFEGGYQNYAEDHGNYIKDKSGKTVNIGTNHGIAGTTLAEYYRLNKKGIPTATDVKNLSKAEAVTIFKKLFWDKYSFDNIKNQGLAEFLFDMSLGSSYWIKWCNKALNEYFGSNLPTSNTFSFGKNQIDLINSAKDPAKLLSILKKYRLAWYNAIVAEAPDQKKFLQSWINRTEYMYNKWKNNITEVVDESIKEVKKKPYKAILILVVAFVGIFLIYKYGIKKYLAISATTPVI